MKRALTGWLLVLLVLAGCAARGGISPPPPSNDQPPVSLDGQAQNPVEAKTPAETQSPPENDPTGLPEDANVPENAAPGEGDDLPGNGEDSPTLEENGSYNSKEEVALYLHLYDHLPDNYITKKEARALGWTGGSVERLAPGCAIGGDSFGNREGRLPAAEGRTYHECDIDTLGQDSRGAKRIVYSNDGLIYYTGDHYESFTLLYGDEP